MKTVIEFRTGYNYDADEHSHNTGLDCTGDPGHTQQQFKDECDINEIVRRFGLTGELPDNYRAPLVGDFTNVTDYQTALNAILAADEAFYQIPPETRARFNNDPQQLMAFLDDDKNRDEAQKLGLLKPQPTAPEPIKVTVVQSESAKPA